jgi:hypothetical protein
MVGWGMARTNLVVLHVTTLLRCATGAASDSDGAREGKVATGHNPVARGLAVTTRVTFPGDTDRAANSTGNPNVGFCNGIYYCVNDCPSLFYKVTGGAGGNITASACGTANFFQLFYVWKGNGSGVCAGLTCHRTIQLVSHALRPSVTRSHSVAASHHSQLPRAEAAAARTPRLRSLRGRRNLGQSTTSK